MAGLKLKSLLHNGRFIFVGWAGLCRRRHILNMGLIGSEECLAPKEHGVKVYGELREMSSGTQEEGMRETSEIGKEPSEKGSGNRCVRLMGGKRKQVDRGANLTDRYMAMAVLLPSPFLPSSLPILLAFYSYYYSFFFYFCKSLYWGMIDIKSCRCLMYTS